MDEKEIEFVKSQINDITELIGELEEPSSPEDLRREQLGILFMKHQDGELSQEENEHLQNQLLNDPKVMHEYVEFSQLTALLHLHFNPELAEQALPFYLYS